MFAKLISILSLLHVIAYFRRKKLSMASDKVYKLSLAHSKNYLLFWIRFWFFQVIKLLNQASLATNDSEKVEKLHQVQELVINKQPDLLDNFTDEVVAFQADRSSDVRKFVVGFMEEAWYVTKWFRFCVIFAACTRRNSWYSQYIYILVLSWRDVCFYSRHL